MALSFDAAKLAEVKKDADRMRQVGMERKELETKILASSKDPKSASKDRVLQLDLPKQHGEVKSDKTPPAKVADLWYQVRKKVGDIRHELPAGIIGPSFDDEYGDGGQGGAAGWLRANGLEPEAVDRLRARLTGR